MILANLILASSAIGLTLPLCRRAHSLVLVDDCGIVPGYRDCLLSDSLKRALPSWSKLTRASLDAQC
jgi:hypothetical protein